MRLFLITMIFFIYHFSEAQVGRGVSLEWDPISSVKKYEIEFKEDSGKIISFESEQAYWKGQIPPGKYLFRVRGKDRRGVTGPWTEPEQLTVKVPVVTLISPLQNAEMIVENSQTQEIKFQWTSLNEVKNYHIKIENDRNEILIEQILADSSISVKVPVGAQYKWSVQVQTQEGKLSDPVVSYLTLLSTTAAKPRLIQPKNKFVRKIEWNLEKIADSAEIVVYRFDEKKDQYQIQQESKTYATDQMDFPMEWAGGRYKVSAFAKKNGKVISQKDEIEFEVEKGDRSPASETKYYIEGFLSRESGDFAALNYVASQVRYLAKSPKYNSISDFEAMTGTLQGSYGRLFPWGFGVRGQVGLGGILIDQKNYLLSDAQIQLFRKHRVDALADARYWVGLGYRSTPEAQRSLAGGETMVSILGMTSVQVGSDLWYAMNGTWGLKGQGIIEKSIQGKSSDGGALSSGQLLRLSGFLTYNHTTTQQVHAGYTLSQERYLFNSVIAGQESEIEINGSFLNIQFEMGFE